VTGISIVKPVLNLTDIALSFAVTGISIVNPLLNQVNVKSASAMFYFRPVKSIKLMLKLVGITLDVICN